jgi:rubrerythrin
LGAWISSAHRTASSASREKERLMENGRFREIIEFAIRKEQEAVDAYTTASTIVKRANIREMLLAFAKQEEGHKQKLEAIDRKRVRSADLTGVPDLRIADYTDSAEITPTTDYQDVLTIAMKREQRAHDLYTTLASSAVEQDLKRLFEFLAREEARHKLALEKEYDEHVLTNN